MDKEKLFNEIKRILPLLVSSKIKVPIVERKIDWGSSKGQGKRSGGTVKGSMSDISLKGVKTYQIADYSHYFKKYADQLTTNSRLVLINNGHMCENFFKAMEYGLNLDQSKFFAALMYHGDKFFKQDVVGNKIASPTEK
jgi:hypothetical protein